MRRFALIILILLSLIGPSIAANLDQVETGTLRKSCAPWDGSAFDITLEESGYLISVYSGIDAIEKSGGAASFHAKANDKVQHGGAVIIVCDETGKDCKQKTGEVNITTIINDEVTGSVVIPSMGWGRGTNNTKTHMFQVKFIRDSVLCG